MPVLQQDGGLPRQISIWLQRLGVRRAARTARCSALMLLLLVMVDAALSSAGRPRPPVCPRGGTVLERFARNGGGGGVGSLSSSSSSSSSPSSSSSQGSSSSSSLWSCLSLSSSSVPQCLFLTPERSEELCNLSVQDRTTCYRRRNLHLKFCSSYLIDRVGAPGLGDGLCSMDVSRDKCKLCLNSLVETDARIEELYRDFQDLISRFDCLTDYSVKWKCADCQKAYKDWLCAMSLSYFPENSTAPVAPCEDFCMRVEEMCPFFRPIDVDTHAGDPSFVCRDPDIEPLTNRSSGSSCYRPCHTAIDVEDYRAQECPDLGAPRPDPPPPRGPGPTNSTAPSRAAPGPLSGPGWGPRTRLLTACLLAVWLASRTSLQYTSIGLT